MFGPIGARQTSLESQDVSMITLSAGWLTSTALLGGGTFPGNLSFMCLSLSMTERIGKKRENTAPKGRVNGENILGLRPLLTWYDVFFLKKILWSQTCLIIRLACWPVCCSVAPWAHVELTKEVFFSFFTFSTVFKQRQVKVEAPH